MAAKAHDTDSDAPKADGLTETTGTKPEDKKEAKSEEKKDDEKSKEEPKPKELGGIAVFFIVRAVVKASQSLN